MIDMLEGQLKKLARPIAIKLAECVTKTFPVKLPDEVMAKGFGELLDQYMPSLIKIIEDVDTDKLIKEMREAVNNGRKS